MLIEHIFIQINFEIPVHNNYHVKYYILSLIDDLWILGRKPDFAETKIWCHLSRAASLCGTVSNSPWLLDNSTYKL